MTPIHRRMIILRSRSKSGERRKGERSKSVEGQTGERSKSVDRRKVRNVSVNPRSHRGSQHCDDTDMSGGVTFVPLSITASTHRKHLKLLELVGNRSPQQIVVLLRGERRRRKWKWSTLRTKIGNLYGANTMSGYRCFPIQCPILRDFRRFVDQCALSELPKFPLALTLEHATRIVETLKLKKAYTALAVFSLWWACAARLSDIFVIHSNKIVVGSENNTVQVTFVEGKGVKARGEPYTMMVVNPFAVHLQKLIRERGHRKYLISPLQHTELTALFKVMLKAFDKRYELRSPRRGALQAMGMHGTPLAVLRSISGHRSDAMLLRYLDWGRFAAVQSNAQVTATNLLWA